MTTFIDTDKGALNTDHVLRIIERIKSKDTKLPYAARVETVLIYRDVDGEYRSAIATDSMLDPEQLAMPIPAQSGYFVVSVYLEEPHEVYRIPIIAWRAEPGRPSARPVCVEEPYGDWAILCPDGQVLEAGCCIYTNLEQYRQARIEGLHARKAATPAQVTSP